MKIKNYHLIVLFILICIFTLNSCGSDSTVHPVTTPVSTTFTVKGTVTNSQAQPVEGVTCTLEVYGLGIAGSVIYTTQTDSSGKYSFSNISAGRYKLSASKDGYVKVNTIFNASNSQIYSTVNVIMARYDGWNAVMGSAHPYNANTGYIMVSTMDSVITDGATARDMTAQFDPMGSVSVELVSNKDGAPVIYHSRGYLNNNGTMDWSAGVTFAKGIACFYDVRTGEASTISATKSGYYFTTVTDAAATAGEINHYILIGTKGGVGGSYSVAVQRVADKSPLKGICYKPSPHDYRPGMSGIYNDSDFCNDGFNKLWGSDGRDDIGNFAKAGVNFLHMYDLNQPGSGRNHTNFMNYCNRKGISIAYSVSAWFVGNINNGSADTWLTNFVNEVYPGGKRNAAVIMWCVGNEPELGENGQTIELAAKTIAKLIQAEDRAGIADSERIAITCPLCFGLFGGTSEGIVKLQELKTALKNNGVSDDVFNNRFIAAINTFKDGPSLKTYVETTFPSASAAINNGKSIPFCFFEIGKEIGGDVTTEDAQGEYYKSQISSVFPSAKSTGPFFGACVFSTVNEAWKTGTEATFGVYKISANGTVNAEGYPVDTWSEKPNFTVMKDYYTQH
ncbi:MAG TPA: carboxypeptidase regulatory-like domain-containing protein [Candidatus Eremiobacteraeota bacterium]|nr:carboxypeptidase regulatory-like domain-containing protein [Candidatus Eremiobacteraeota bacterium]